MLPQNQPGARRVDDRRVISGIIHVLKSGCRWRDCPAVFGPSRPSTIAGTAGRGARSGAICSKHFGACRPMTTSRPSIPRPPRRTVRRPVEKGGAEAQAIGRSRGGRTTKIHAVCDSLGRAIALEVTPGQRGDIRAALPLLSSLPPPRCCAADTAYDANELRQFLIERGTTPVIPNNPTRKRFHPFDRAAYKRRNLVERMFCRLKDWRRIATRYDKLARNFLSAVNLAAAIIWWT
ncbi:IS5 family transposase [Bradyrhizobium sp. ISRA435]|nr:IS5 family transposase [Bradyrhizobium sp. ISRA435]